jgi:hypothetical protein
VADPPAPARQRGHSRTRRITPFALSCLAYLRLDLRTTLHSSAAMAWRLPHLPSGKALDRPVSRGLSWTESLRTLRWKEMDSNLRSPSRKHDGYVGGKSLENRCFSYGTPKVRIHLFHRRVCELWFLSARAPSAAYRKRVAGRAWARSRVTLTSALTSAPEGSRVPIGARRAVRAAKASGRDRFGAGTTMEGGDHAACGKLPARREPASPAAVLGQDADGGAELTADQKPCNSLAGCFGGAAMCVYQRSRWASQT